MRTAARVLGALLLLCLASFCAFGFVAKYEPSGSPILGGMYALIGAACASGSIHNLRRLVPFRPTRVYCDLSTRATPAASTQPRRTP